MKKEIKKGNPVKHVETGKNQQRRILKADRRIIEVYRKFTEFLVRAQPVLYWLMNRLIMLLQVAGDGFLNIGIASSLVLSGKRSLVGGNKIVTGFSGCCGKLLKKLFSCESFFDHLFSATWV
ncbi:MAG: hypothetical protein N3F08_06085 [Crenarchaeota archaeon]|nr:hypothetical protein [Thermoproteota archaeon]